MATCASADVCPFYGEVEASLVKRIRYASAYPYCNGGKSAACAIQVYLLAGNSPESDLLPDGSHADYRGDSGPVVVSDRSRRAAGDRFLVVEDSPIFAGFASNTIRFQYPGADVVECHTFADAARELRAGTFKLVVSGFGLDGGKTAHDIRQLCDAPMVLLTGRIDRDTTGLGRVVAVHKGAGSDAVRDAIGGLLGA